MNKKQFIERMVEHTDSPRTDAEKHLEAFTTAISEALKAGEEVQLPGFGKFYVREQKAREGRNPQSGEKLTIPASKVPAFSAGNAPQRGSLRAFGPGSCLDERDSGPFFTGGRSS